MNRESATKPAASSNLYAQTFANSTRFAVLLTAFGLVAFLSDYFALRASVSRHLRVEDVPVVSDLRATEDAEKIITGKPVMTTFFEPVPEGCCGMTAQGHDNLVNSWKAAWEGHGWTTRIFAEADARKHPDFDRLEKALIEANVSEYDRRCFWRWLAMAVDDDPQGGWMSDYDLFPLTLTSAKGLELMKQPGFKTYGGHVPALIHADQKSWDSIVQRMIAAVKPDLDISFISDMMLLEYLHNHYTEEELNISTWEFALWKKFPYKRLPGKDDPVIDCELVKNHLAAHLSHRGSQEAFEVTHTYPKIEEEIKKGEYAEFRSQAADVMMRDLGECVEESVERD